MRVRLPPSALEARTEKRKVRRMDNVFELKCEYGIVDAACQCEVCRLQREETDARRVEFYRALEKALEGVKDGD